LPETSRISPVSAQPKLRGFDVPNFLSQKIPESTSEVSVGQKKSLKNEQLWLKNTKLRFSKI
jgi:hypothetical protein